MKEYIPLSVIVPVYNRLKLTNLLLDSFVNSENMFEVVLIDDNSRSDIKSLTELYDSTLDIIYYRNPNNRGPAKSRNTGIKLSSHNYIAFTDNDCIVHKNWASKIFKYIKNSSKAVAGVGGRVLSVGKSVFDKYFDFHKILDPFFLNSTVLYLVTANCCFKKEILMEVNGFDEYIKFPGGEDPGLSFKITNRGYKLDYFPDAIVYHHYCKKIRTFFKTFFRYGLGCRDQTEKYYKPVVTAKS